MLPLKTSARAGPLVEQKTRGEISQGRQGRHLTLGHVSFGQVDVKAIKADRQYSGRVIPAPYYLIIDLSNNRELFREH